MLGQNMREVAYNKCEMPLSLQYLRPTSAASGKASHCSLGRLLVNNHAAVPCAPWLMLKARA